VPSPTFKQITAVRSLFWQSAAVSHGSPGVLPELGWVNVLAQTASLVETVVLISPQEAHSVLS
jgi:hypothetical protein